MACRQLLLVLAEFPGELEGAVAQDSAERADRTACSQVIDREGMPHCLSAEPWAGDAGAFYDPPGPVSQS